MTQSTTRISTSPLVSVIVPTYNQCQYLAACLDSIYFQDYGNLEIIVVNDASTDDTRAVLEAYAIGTEKDQTSFATYFDAQDDHVERTIHKRYPQQGRKLSILHNVTNQGSTATYNRGFAHARGIYATYVASDDLCHPQMISTLIEPLEKNIADFVYADMFIIDDDGRILREFKVPDYSFERCFCDWYLCGVAKLYRTRLCHECGQMDTAYLANDHEQYLRFARAGARFLHVSKTLYSVRSHAGREENVHSSTNWQRLIEESKQLIRTARTYRKVEI